MFGIVFLLREKKEKNKTKSKTDNELNCNWYFNYLPKKFDGLVRFNRNFDGLSKRFNFI